MKVKGWHFVWILWLVLAVVNLLFINVYINHFGTTIDGVQTLGDIQSLGYVGLTVLLLVVMSVWFILIGNTSEKKGITVLGAILTAIFGLALIGSVVYVLAFKGDFVRTVINALAGAFKAISF